MKSWCLDLKSYRDSFCADFEGPFRNVRNAKCAKMIMRHAHTPRFTFSAHPTGRDHHRHAGVDIRSRLLVTRHTRCGRQL